MHWIQESGQTNIIKKNFKHLETYSTLVENIRYHTEELNMPLKIVLIISNCVYRRILRKQIISTLGWSRQKRKIIEQPSMAVTGLSHHSSLPLSSARIGFLPEEFNSWALKVSPNINWKKCVFRKFYKVQLWGTLRMTTMSTNPHDTAMIAKENTEC